MIKIRDDAPPPYDGYLPVHEPHRSAARFEETHDERIYNEELVPSNE
jgi:hypothetical protein